MLYSILMVVQVLLAIGVIALVLLQHGKGADAGAAFGSGASSTVFGSRGSANFLSRGTAVLATLFFINSLTLAYMAGDRPMPTSVVDSVTESVAPAASGEAPAAGDVADVPVQDGSTDQPEDIPR